MPTHLHLYSCPSEHAQLACFFSISTYYLIPFYQSVSQLGCKLLFSSKSLITIFVKFLSLQGIAVYVVTWDSEAGFRVAIFV